MRNRVLLIILALFYTSFSLLFSGTDEVVSTQNERLRTKVQIAMRQLDSSSEVIRKRASNELINMGKEIVPFLKGALKDIQTPGRAEIPFILGEIGDQSVIPDLISVISEGQTQSALAQNAVLALKLFKNPKSVDGLINLLGKTEITEQIKSDIAEALTEITTHNFGKDASKWQKWWNNNKNSVIKGSNELIALSDIPQIPPTDSSLLAILKKMQDPNAESRSIAIKEYNDLNNPQKISIIFQINILTKDPFENVRYKAIRTLGSLKNPAGIRALSNLISTSSDVRTQQEVLLALAQIGDIRGVPPIIQMMEKNSNPDLLISITDSFYQFNDTVTDEQIIQNLNSWNTYIQKFCIKTIANKKLTKFAKNINEVLSNDDDESIKTECIKTIGLLKLKSTVPTLFDLMQKDKNSMINIDIIKILPALLNEDKGINPDFWIKWWNENKQNILKQAQEAEQIELKQDIAAKDEKLHSRDWQIRIARIREIGNSGEIKLIDSLIPFMEKDPVWVCRNEAKKSIESFYAKNKDILISNLSSYIKENRDNAKKILIGCGDSFLHDVLNNLNSGNYITKKSCAEILGVLQKKETIDYLVNAIKESGYKGIQPSPYALAYSNFSGDAAAKILPVLSSDIDEESDGAFWAISKIDKRYLIPALPYILKKLKNKDVFLKEEASRILFEITGEKLKSCKDADEWKSKKIAKYPDLSSYKPEEAIVLAALRELKDNLNTQINNLSSHDLYAFEKAKKFLLENADQDALTQLLEMYKIDNPKLKTAIIDCMSAAPDLSYQLVLNNLNADGQPAQECALIVANRWKNPSDFIMANKILYQCLTSLNKQVRRNAVSLISEFKLSENIDFLSKTLKDSDPYVKAEASKGLAYLNAVQFIRDIQRELNNIFELSPQLTLAESLAALGDTSGAIYFQKLLTAANYDVIKEHLQAFPLILSPSFEEQIISVFPNLPDDIKANFILYLGYIGTQKSLDFFDRLSANSNQDLFNIIEISKKMISNNEIILF